ncbi:MAG: hypothetical protein IIW86_00530, partial [Clostridia bacterium]|nr:hypothetical protein [Clostridia bacterium]
MHCSICALITQEYFRVHAIYPFITLKNPQNKYNAKDLGVKKDSANVDFSTNAKSHFLNFPRS